MADGIPGEEWPAGEASRKEVSAGRWVLALLREVALTALPALAIALFINVAVARATTVESISMEPTLYETQRLIVEKVSYHFHPPRRGDIVVFRDPGLGPIPFVKRVVGLPGEVVEIRDGQVLIDGQVLQEPYLHQATYPGVSPLLVPEDAIFVMGDNRGYSQDSRYFGCVQLSDVEGRACFRYWPLSAFGPLQ